jgi:predicted ATPase
LGLSESADRPPLSLLDDFLRPRQALLILDSCEHLVEAAAHLVAALLCGCSRLQILATSREALAVPGEINYRVQPLALPPVRRGERPSRAAVEGYDAIQLFVERARTARRGFALTNPNAPAVTRICRRLDGIPLAIELAAAWVNLLSPEQIADRLDNNLELLVSDSRTVPLRQQTLAAAIDWSYNLLSEKEQTLLRRLCVFAGGWSLDAAESVAGEAPPVARKETLALLHRLVNKSLAAVEHSPEGEARYRLLETIRQYLREKLAETGEETETRNRHLGFFFALAAELEAQTRGPTQSAALAAFDRDDENFRAALAWAFAPERPLAQGELIAPALAARLGRTWYVRQHWREGRAWLAKALAALGLDPQRPPPDASQAQGENSALAAELLFRAGHLAGGQGDLLAAQHLLEQSLALERTLGDRRGIARCLQELGGIASEEGDYDRAAAWLTESLGYVRSLGDEWLLVVSLGKLADVAGEQNDQVRSEEFAREQLAIAQRIGDPGLQITALNLLAQCAIGTGRFVQAVELLEAALAMDRQRNPHSQGGPWTLRNLGLAWQMLGDYEQAADYYRRSLRLRWEQEQAGGMAWALEGLGEVVALTGHPQEAVRMWGAADRLRRSVGSTMSRSDWLRHEPIVTATRALFEPETFMTAWAEGESLSPEQVVVYALNLVFTG